MHRRDFLASAAALASLAAARPAAAGGEGAHAFRFASLDGGELALADWAGKPILVVNTASMCAFTPQYDALQALWDKYRDRGLIVVGAPSRDFGRQEYDDAAKIKDFCEVNFSIDFPMTEIVKVKGAGAHPFYAWAREAGRTRDLPAPRWNFHKYLIAPDGALAAAWGSTTPPDAPEIRAAIEAMLPAG